MERGDLRECELERELEGLYRKVAGLDQPEDGRERTVPAGPGTAPPQAAGSGAGRRPGRRFPTRLYGGLALALAVLGAVGLLRWQGGRAAAPEALPTAGGGGGIIARAADGTAVRPVMPPAGEPPRTTGGELAAADPPAGDRPARYAIQIRAYPEQQKQKALLFLAELRDRTPDASLETVSTAGRGVWHRILLGDFPTVEQAAEYRTVDRVAREHPYGFIQRKYANGPGPAPAARSASARPPAQP